MKAHRAFWLVVLVPLGACPPPPPSTPIDVLHPPGRTYCVQTVEPLVGRQPIDAGRIDPLTAYRASPGRALPPGARVTRFSNDDPRAAQSASPKVDPVIHPWVFVEVLSSPIPAQTGWVGWVHVEGLTDAAVDPVVGTPGLMGDPAHLCAWPDTSAEPSATCPLEIHPSLHLDVIECNGQGYVRVQLWDPEGNYVTGYLRRSHFQVDPCP